MVLHENVNYKEKSTGSVGSVHQLRFRIQIFSTERTPIWEAQNTRSVGRESVLMRIDCNLGSSLTSTGTEINGMDLLTRDDSRLQSTLPLF